MKASELRTKTCEELEAMLKDLKSELFTLRFQHAINQLENPHKIADENIPAFRPYRLLLCWPRSCRRT